MEVGAGYSQTRTEDGSDSDPSERGKVFQLLVCPACEGVISRTRIGAMIASNQRRIFLLRSYIQEIRVYPPGLPPVIRKAFLLAQRVKPIDLNAFGVMMGRVLEEICADTKASERILADKLKDRADRGEITGEVGRSGRWLEKASQLGRTRRTGRAHPPEGSNRRRSLPSSARLSICRTILYPERHQSPIRCHSKVTLGGYPS
jgi:hypothetical protein